RARRLEGARRGADQRHRGHHQQPPQEGRTPRRAPAHPHGARRGLRAEGPVLMRLSIRWRLTLWYGGVLAAVLTAFGAAVFFTIRHHLLTRIARGLTEELADVLSEVRRASDEAGLLEWLHRRFAHHEGFDFQLTRPSGARFFTNVRLADTFLPLPGEDDLA